MNRSRRLRAVRALGTAAALVGIVAASLVGLDEWADGVATHDVQAGAAASGPAPASMR